MNHFLHFLNRILYPVVVLKTIEDVEAFANTDIEWQENTPFYKSYRQVGYNIPKTTRVIAFVNKNEYKEELDKLEHNALNLCLRDDLRIARMTNPAVIKHFKEKYNNVWFEKISSSSIVLLRKKEDFIGL